MNVINIDEKLKLFQDHWSPKIVGELNGQQVKLAKLNGEFVWHKHENEDEFFYVIRGSLIIEFRDKIETILENEFIIVPRGVEHRPIARSEVSVMLFEPASTINTGETDSAFTVKELERL
jgi:mannose-6-phosphate isomerase-like protein (cupin superfamily)